MDGISFTLSLLLISMLSFQGGNAQKEPEANVQLNLPAGKCLLYSFNSVRRDEKGSERKKRMPIQRVESRIDGAGGPVCSVDYFKHFACRAVLLTSTVAQNSSHVSSASCVWR